jgi:hypothetical protein
MGRLNSLLFCALLAFFAAVSSPVFSQCDAKISYQIKAKSQGLSEVIMKRDDNSQSVKIQLYDLNSGSVVDEVQKFVGNEYVTVFDNVKPSIYAFYVWSPGCKKPTVISEKGGVSIEK